MASVRRVLAALGVAACLIAGGGASFAAAPQSSSSTASTARAFRAKVAAIVDGDTIHVIDGSGNIACASDAHVALIWEKALRHGWKVTLGPGIAAASTRPGRALIGLLDWIETDFSASHLRRLLQSGDMGIGKDDEGFTAGEGARTLARAEAGWGRATYGLSLGLLQKSYESRAADPDLSDVERDAARAKASLTSNIADWVNRLIASVPAEGPNGKVRLPPIVDAALAYLSPERLSVPEVDVDPAGAGLFPRVTPALVLTALGKNRSIWGPAVGIRRCQWMSQTLVSPKQSCHASRTGANSVSIRRKRERVRDQPGRRYRSTSMAQRRLQL